MSIQNEILKTLPLLNKKYQDMGFKIFSLFGSYARGTQDNFSDIDLTYKIGHNKFIQESLKKSRF